MYNRAMNQEIWKPIPGFEGLYSASSLGRICSENRVVKHYSGGPKHLTGAIRKLTLGTFGYLNVLLCKENCRTRFAVHRLVLMAFSGQLGEGLDARHLNGNRTDNRIENLAWGTRKENMADAVAHGKTNRGANNPNAKLDPSAVVQIRALLANKHTQASIAATFGVDQSIVSDIKRREIWGYVA
jgi:predicted XRE-type DNA-binding protein